VVAEDAEEAIVEEEAEEEGAAEGAEPVNAAELTLFRLFADASPFLPAPEAAAASAFLSPRGLTCSNCEG